MSTKDLEEEKKDASIANIRFKPSGDDIFKIDANKNQFSAVVIFLHGLGDRGSSWQQAMQSIAESMPYIKWIFPTAATAPVTLYGGMRSTAWHDIVSLDDWAANKAFTGRDVSVDFITQIIETELAENESLTSQRILLGGFSQGGAIALYTGLTTERRLAGIVCLSGYCPETDIKSRIKETNKDIPILMYHSKVDAIVDSKLASMAYTALKQECGVKNIQLKYNGAKASPLNNNGHCTTPDEMRDVARFIQRCLPADTNGGNGTDASSSFCVCL